VIAACERWDVTATTIGAVTADDRLRVLDHGAVVATCPSMCSSTTARCTTSSRRPPP